MRRNSSVSEASLKQLSLLVGAGIPLSKALDSVEALREAAEKVKSGASLAESLSGSFPITARNMIAVGERSGDLSGAIQRACDYMENRSRLKRKIVSSLIYPSFVLMLCFVAIFILVSVLLPSFTGIFDSLGIKLPLINRVIIGASRYFPLMLIACAALIAGIIRYVLSDGGLKLPLIGSFRRELINATFFDSLSQYLNAGLSVVDSLNLAIETSNSLHYREKLENVRNTVLEGGALCSSLDAARLFEPSDISLISAGESSSSLSHVFSRLAAHHEEKIENAIKTFSSLVEPISTLATGLVVGIIVFAMFMPIIRLISVLGS